MKIKIDFVTNSSSACYILSIKEDEIENLKKYLKKLDKDPNASNEGVTCYFASSNLQELMNYTNGREYDWASKPRGFQFNELSEESYNVCKEIIDEKNAVAIVRVDYNVCERFEDFWKDSVVECLE